MTGFAGKFAMLIDSHDGPTAIMKEPALPWLAFAEGQWLVIPSHLNGNFLFQQIKKELNLTDWLLF